ncbi:hypothetical protein MADE_000001021710 [Alteromonas mediterranea DE]|uniref:Uncharacterized protein n=1 Tax=Alteromonas mediterranea (strain DSM 17117 / CIP 110805 / LMG 28347 / Deep ecotype) TaxID=1774373 RepID=T2DMU5_ALTMD|nr:hypothetical protein MADE_000001021710 [Alteromonas mediterranea DE]
MLLPLVDCRDFGGDFTSNQINALEKIQHK